MLWLIALAAYLEGDDFIARTSSVTLNEAFKRARLDTLLGILRAGSPARLRPRALKFHYQRSSGSMQLADELACRRQNLGLIIDTAIHIIY
jgi:hypothetical protein